jgi:hypothetical protein
VAAGVRPGTRRVYSSYWNRIEKHWRHHVQLDFGVVPTRWPDG